MEQNGGYKILDLETYYRKDIYRRFTKVALSSVSITHRIDVTDLAEHSRKTCTPVYTEYDPDYKTFYEVCKADIEKARHTREFLFNMEHHPNWFDASYIPWISYVALHVELPDGYLYYQPIINWGRY